MDKSYRQFCLGNNTSRRAASAVPYQSHQTRCCRIADCCPNRVVQLDIRSAVPRQIEYQTGSRKACFGLGQHPDNQYGCQAAAHSPQNRTGQYVLGLSLPSMSKPAGRTVNSVGIHDMRVLAGFVIASLVASAGALSGDASNDTQAVDRSAAGVLTMIHLPKHSRKDKK